MSLPLFPSPLLLALLLGLPARADAQSLDAHGFRLGGHQGDPQGFLGLHDPFLGRAGAYGGTLVLDYADAPLSAMERGAPLPVLERLLGANLQAGFSPTGKLRLDASLPLYPYAVDRTGRFTALGDLRFSANYLLFSNPDLLSVSFVPELRAPTGAGERFLGEPGLGVAGLFALGRRVGPLSLCANLGAEWGHREPFLNVGSGSALLGGLGVAWLLDTSFALGAEIRASSALNFSSEERPVEALLGARKRFDGGLHVEGGLGGGLTSGIGASRTRLLAGVGWAHPGRRPSDDRDKDGVKDGVDRCPEVPEDLDGFADQDGCPELDNDKDGILDPHDSCPEVPEDLDGVQDEDGCPETDADGDGVEDPIDGCPMAPEDMDGDRDRDGCPEDALDRDGDGIPDEMDACPERPILSFQDPATSDGCPRAAVVTEDAVVLGGPVLFMPRNSAFKETKEDASALESLRQLLLERREIRRLLIVVGSTDHGEEQMDIALSEARARAVMHWLVSHGVDARRLETLGLGTVSTKSGPSTAQGASFVVEFRILEREAPAVLP